MAYGLPSIGEGNWGQKILDSFGFVKGELDGRLSPSSLSASYTSRSAAPRGGQRPVLARRPSLVIDQVWPNAIADFQIVFTDGELTLYATGADNTLRKSTDAGVSWTSKHFMSISGTPGWFAKGGLFFKTAAGSFLTTFHPDSLAAPKIVRSTDDCATWSDVVAAQTDVDYLGPTSICQDPNTGHLYLVEYVTVNAATKATWRIMRSTDDGATWTTFHTFQRDAVANPDTATRHGHHAQWDPISERVYFGCGDGENAAGIYRVNAAGTGIEAVIVRTQLPAGLSAGAVGLMFFPNYLAWGNDQFANSGLIRMARSEIGDPAPEVELVATVQATSFYTARTTADNTEWIMTVSNEDGAGGRLDNAFHLYRVADDGATIDEVMTLPSPREAGFFWVYPVATPEPVPGHTSGRLWWRTDAPSRVMPFTGHSSGFAIQTRLAWGGQGLVRPDAVTRKPSFQPVSVDSGRVFLRPAEKRIFAVTEVPDRARVLHIMETNVATFEGAGLIYLEVGTWTQGARDQTLGTGLALSAAANTVTAPAHGLAADTPVRFSAVTPAAGTSGSTVYYVVNPTADTFQVSTTRGGSVVDITSDATATVKFDPLPVFTLLKAEDAVTDMQWQNRSRKAVLRIASAPWIMRSPLLATGTRIAFRVNNVLINADQSAEGVAGITYAWGFA